MPEPQICFVSSVDQFNLQILLQLYRKCFGELPVTGPWKWRFLVIELYFWDNGALKALYMVKTLQDSLGKTYYSLIKTAFVYHDLQWEN